MTSATPSVSARPLARMTLIAIASTLLLVPTAAAEVHVVDRAVDTVVSLPGPGADDVPAGEIVAILEQQCRRASDPVCQNARGELGYGGIRPCDRDRSFPNSSTVRSQCFSPLNETRRIANWSASSSEPPTAPVASWLVGVVVATPGGFTTIPGEAFRSSVPACPPATGASPADPVIQTFGCFTLGYVRDVGRIADAILTLPLAPTLVEILDASCDGHDTFHCHNWRGEFGYGGVRLCHTHGNIADPVREITAPHCFSPSKESHRVAVWASG